MLERIERKVNLLSASNRSPGRIGILGPQSPHISLNEDTSV